ncbi:MAG: hypothetical protein OXJ52_07915 [Oligoflexia bacterium]|nr:hypothetical protein [Oligoflexia bacterium]
MKKQGFLRDQRGVAMVEMLPLLSIFVILFGLTFGLWISIHSGILQSISARHYAFEVINNRTHFIYHRDIIEPGDKKSYYEKDGKRFFAIVELQASASPYIISEKKSLSLFDKDSLRITGDPGSGSPQRNPIWLKTGYGICIDFNCGD